MIPVNSIFDEKSLKIRFNIKFFSLFGDYFATHFMNPAKLNNNFNSTEANAICPAVGRRKFFFPNVLFVLPIIFFFFFVASPAYGATEFVATVMQSGGDYSSLSSWEAAINTDLTVSSTKVYSVSSSTGSISDAATVVGSVSTTTKAKVKHYSSLNSQILIENIRKILTGTSTFSNTTSTVTGSGTLFTTELQVNDYIWLESSQTWQKISSITSNTELTLTATSTISGTGSAAQQLRTGQSGFQSGEQLQVDINNYAVISDNGQDPIAIAKIDGAWTSADTTAVTIDGWTTDATNYIKIYTTTAARHDGKWNTGKYRLEVTAAGNWEAALDASEDFVTIEGLQIQMTAVNKVTVNGIRVNPSDGGEIKISHNIIKGVLSGTTSGFGIRDEYAATGTKTGKIWNNIVYDWINSGVAPAGISLAGVLWTHYVYNNTVYNCYYGIAVSGGGTAIAKNNISYNNTDNYTGTFTSSDYNLSGPTQTDAPGANSRQGVTVSFVSTTPGSEDFHLQSSDAGARNYGTSSVSEIGFTDDIDGQTRSGIWDIGADEFINYSPNSPVNLGQYLSDCSTSLSTSTYWTGTSSLCFKGVISDSNPNDQVKLQLELATSTFSNSVNYTASAFATSTATSSILVSGLSETQYRWQARSLDYDSATSSFIQFNSGNLSFGVDLSAPASGFISYTDGYYSTLSVSLTTNDGTDSGSGLNTLTRQIQRKESVLSGSCGSFGSFATITISGTYPDFIDSSVNYDKCYQYRYLISDNVSNQAIYTSTSTAKVYIENTSSLSSYNPSLNPLLSGISVSGIASSSCLISWITNRPADSWVEYGKTLAFGSQTEISPNIFTFHFANLKNLFPSSAYYFRIKAKDGAGNETLSKDYSFLTLADSVSETMPAASSVATSSVGATSSAEQTESLLQVPSTPQISQIERQIKDLRFKLIQLLTQFVEILKKKLQARR